MRKLFRLAALFLLLAAPALHAEILIKPGQSIGFMGDSITAQGNAPSGYIGLTIYALKTEGVDAKAIPAGVPGHTSANMRARVGPQILDAHADWMTLSCGVNDVMMQTKGHGVDLDTYKKNVAFMVDACRAKNVNVILLTPTPLGEDLTNANNHQLAGYVDFLLAYGKENHIPVADINAAFQAYLKTPAAPTDKPGARLLADGIHPNQIGQKLMAKTLILALGIPPADLPGIEQAWLDNPQGKSVKVGQGTFALISQKQFDALNALDAKHQRANNIVADLWKQAQEKSPKDPQSQIGALVDAYLKNAASPAR